MNRFQFVDDHHLAFGVKRLCRVLGLNRSSYYKWRDSAEARAAREAADQTLAGEIRTVHADSDGAYGSPRVTAELRADGRKINEKRVARVMRKFSIMGIRLRRRVRTTIPDLTGLEPAAFDDLAARYQAWCTEHPPIFLPGKRPDGGPGAGSRRLSVADQLVVFLLKKRWSMTNTALAKATDLAKSRIGATLQEVTPVLTALGHTVPAAPSP